MTRPLPTFAVFVAIVVAANWLTNALGVVTWLGLTATAGTWLAGFGFVARDALDDNGGPPWVAAAILTGAGISALFSPELAIASAVAFLLSECADWAVYTPLRNRGHTRAALASNAVGAVVDTVVFLTLAGFPLTGTPTQVAVKIGTTTAFVLGVRFALHGQPVWARGGGRHG